MMRAARAVLIPMALGFAWVSTPARAEPTWATQHAEDLTRMGQEQISRGDVPAATRRFLEAIAADPTYAPVYLALGNLYESTGELKEAERTYAMGIEHVVGFAGARVARAHLYSSLHRTREAILDLEVAAVERPDDEALLDELTRAYVATGAMPAALAATRRLVALAERRGDAHAEQAARLRLKALEMLVAELDPVLAGRRDRGPVRRAIALGARRAP
jgi:tetratricopeptide (TPR) repeat protein